VCSKEHTIRACVFYRTHTLLSIHLDILKPHLECIQIADSALKAFNPLCRVLQASRLALALSLGMRHQRLLHGVRSHQETLRKSRGLLFDTRVWMPDNKSGTLVIFKSRSAGVKAANSLDTKRQERYFCWGAHLDRGRIW
jgi:hypothetical protein